MSVILGLRLCLHRQIAVSKSLFLATSVMVGDDHQGMKNSCFFMNVFEGLLYIDDIFLLLLKKLCGLLYFSNTFFSAIFT